MMAGVGSRHTDKRYRGFFFLFGFEQNCVMLLGGEIIEWYSSGKARKFVPLTHGMKGLFSLVLR